MAKFCMKCGAENQEGTSFCMKCGAPLNAENAAQPIANNAPVKKAKAWDGGVLETFVAMLVTSIITTITCGIGAPWAMVYMIKFIASHVVVDGKRYVFTGTGGALFGNYIVWTILTVITCGIYSFWVVPKLYNWIFENVHEA